MSQSDTNPISYGSLEKACLGKQRYESAAEAQQAAKWVRKTFGPKVKTYLCQHCGHWHIGHDRRRKT